MWLADVTSGTWQQQQQQAVARPGATAATGATAAVAAATATAAVPGPRFKHCLAAVNETTFIIYGGLDGQGRVCGVRGGLGFRV